jgi:hypothetical protein
MMGFHFPPITSMVAEIGQSKAEAYFFPALFFFYAADFQRLLLKRDSDKKVTT